ncbi:MULTISPECIES: hypothetical protein [Acidobacteriaceae]|uniref:hypothetical protein n=1 Tax=Acidobacteriaceae TaxID=204434 RepID=UPI00131B2264|nr:MULTISPECIES: hypothetical protein [Acidobacteriaceae]MDW5266930.1 hypothetical protein [Edaphobacter sp.]
MSQITIERLKEIAETEYEDVDPLIMAVREIALGLAQVMESGSKPASAPPAQQQSSGGRVMGKPIPPDLKRTTCRSCHEDVVVFISKRTQKPYLCDVRGRGDL